MGVRVGSQAASPPSSTSLHAVSAGRLRRAFRAPDIASLLVSLSRDVFNLTYLGMVERLRELLAVDTQLVNAVAPRAGIALLFCLPDDEGKAINVSMHRVPWWRLSPCLPNVAGRHELPLRSRCVGARVRCLAMHRREGLLSVKSAAAWWSGFKARGQRATLR